MDLPAHNLNSHKHVILIILVVVGMTCYNSLGPALLARFCTLCTILLALLLRSISCRTAEA